MPGTSGHKKSRRTMGLATIPAVLHWHLGLRPARRKVNTMQSAVFSGFTSGRSGSTARLASTPEAHISAQLLVWRTDWNQKKISHTR